MLRILKDLISLENKLRIKTAFTKKDNDLVKIVKHRNKPTVFIFLAGFYQNLGDMAITLAQVKFLRDMYPNHEILPVSSESTFIAIKSIKRYVNTSDIITIVGGGNMSDMYIHLELSRRNVVKSFPKNRIISFPQTVDFSNTKIGNKQLLKSRKVYEGHSNFSMFLREPISYKKAKGYFPNVNIQLCPDIVLFLDERKKDNVRTNVVCCLRSDKEQNITNLEKNEIITNLKSSFSDVIITDTVNVAKEECTPEKYESTLEKFWEMLRQSRVVVTDRLHCMIFCVITGTPCVAMDNSNKKISGVYEAWLQEVPYIRLIKENTVDNVIDAGKELLDYEIPDFDLNSIHEKFWSLRKACVK